MRVRRSLASACCALIQHMLPAPLKPWGQAISVEVSELPGDTEALLFAVNSLFALGLAATRFWLLRASAAIAGNECPTSDGLPTMYLLDDAPVTPRALGVLCAIGAALLGSVYLVMAGAPGSYLGVNLGALVIGLLLLTNAASSGVLLERWPEPTTHPFSVAQA